MTLVITLTSKGHRQTATCEGHSVTRPKGSCVHPLARVLQEAGFDRETPVIVLRGTTVCFSVRPLKDWADWMLYENDTKGGFRLQRWDYEKAAKYAESREQAA